MISRIISVLPLHQHTKLAQQLPSLPSSHTPGHHHVVYMKARSVRGVAAKQHNRFLVPPLFSETVTHSPSPKQSKRDRHREHTVSTSTHLFQP